MRKRHWWRTTLATILCLSLCLATLPQAAFAVAPPAEDLKPDLSKQFALPKPGSAPIELEQRRTLRSKEYLNPDGSFTVASYKDVIHYKEKNGRLVDIDNTLVEAGEAAYKFKNRANSLQVKFAADNATGSLVRIESEAGHWLEFGPRNQLLSPGKAAGRSITFGGSPFIDYEYSVDANRLKEDIILHKFTGQNSFSFSLKTGGLKYRQNNDGTYSFIDSNGNSLFIFLKPFAEDSAGNVTKKAKLEIFPGTSEDEIRITVDQDWLKSAVYPVVIDPVVEEDKNSKSNASDTFVSKNLPTENYWDLTYMHTGYYGSFGTTRSYLRWDYLPTLPTGASIDKVELQLYMYASVVGTNTTIEARNVTGSWNASTVSWNTQPAFASTPVPGSAITRDAVGYFDFNLTEVGKGWYDGALANQGVMLQATSDTATRRSFYTSNAMSSPPPVLKVTYTVDPLGTESFWGYAGNVNVHNGNLLVSATDLSLSGRGVPINISRTYNSRKVQPEDTVSFKSPFGYGWSYNVGMSLTYRDGSVVLLTDGDGTEYRFVKTADGAYQSPVGVYMQLKLEGSVYVLTDQSGVKYHFDSSGRLDKVTDKENAATNISYLADGRVNQVTDPSGRYARFAYNTDNKLSKIYWKLDSVSAETAMVIYEYDTAGNLTVVKKSTNGYTSGIISVSFQYDAAHNLQQITDAAGKVTNIDYDPVHDRVLTITKALDSVTDQVIDATGQAVSSLVTTFNYDEFAPGQTKLTITDPRGFVTEYRTNPRGNVEKIIKDATNTDLNSRQTYSMVWDGQQDLLTVTDPKGNTTRMGYDGMGNLLQLENPEGSTAIYHYNSDGDVVNSTDFAGRTTVNSYDAAKRRLLNVTNAQQATSAISYDAKGNVIREAAPMTQAENILANSGFESWSNGLPNKWARLSGTVTQESVKFSGLYSAKLTGLSSLRSSDYTPIAASSKYALGWSLKTLGVGTNGGAGVFVEWYNSSKVRIGTDNTLLLPANGTSDWSRKQTTVTSPATAAYARIVLSLNQSGTVWFDNLQLEPGSTVNASNLLTNEGFEINVDGDSQLPDGWWGTGLTTNDSVVTNTAKSGSNSFEITGATAGARALGLGVGTVGPAGTAVTFSGWSKSLNMSGAGIYALRLRVTYADGTLEYFPATFSSNNDWAYAESTVVVPKDYTRLALFVWVENMSGEFWFDDLALRYYGAGNALVSDYNPLQNGSFEINANGDGWPDEWTNTHDPNVAGSYDVTWAGSSGSFWPYSGSRAIRIANVPSYVVIGNSIIEELKAGATYSFSAMARTLGVTKGGAAIKIDILQGTTTLGQVQSDILTGNKDWTKLAVSVNTESIKAQYPQADRIKFVVQTKGATDGVVYFDSVRAVEKSVETSYTYDANGNYLKSITNPLGNTVNFDPDNRGRVLTATDPRGKASDFSYDNLDRLKSVVNAANLLTEYTYDNNGNLKTTTNKDDRNGTVLGTNTSEYNALGLVTKAIDPLSRVTEYKYTENGKIAWTKTESGKVAQFRYDRVDRLDQISYSDSGKLIEWRFTYDQNNNRTKVQQLSDGVLKNTVGYTVDKMNRVDTITLPSGQTVSYKYNPAGQVTRVTNSGVGAMVYDYDLGGLNTSVTDPIGNKAEYLYDENGRVIRQSVGTAASTGYTTEITYNAIGQVIEQKIVNAAGGTVAAYSYEYDVNGNRTKAIASDGSSVRYVYDDLNQLTDEEYRDNAGTLTKTISYSYDLVGNRKTKSVTIGGNTTTTSYGYNAANELTGINGVALEAYRDGNQRSTGSRNLSYNVMGRLLRVYSAGWGSVLAEYEYDANGLRTAKLNGAGAVIERYVYNGGKLASITDATGNKRYFFTRSTSGALLGMIDYTGTNPATYWFIKDAHGNVIGLGDKDGNVVASYEYDAWGNILSSSGSTTIGDGSKLLKDANPFRYSGYFYDDESGLYYLNARYYSPELGRFLSMDPISSKDDGLSSNRYLYARNNPVTLLDADGLMPGTEDVDGYNVLAERLPKGDPLEIWQSGGTIAAGPVVQAMSRGIKRAMSVVAGAAKAADRGAQKVFEGATKAVGSAMDQPAVMSAWLATADSLFQETPPLIFKGMAEAGAGFSVFFLIADVGFNAGRYSWSPTAFAMASAVDAVGFLTVLLTGVVVGAAGAPVWLGVGIVASVGIATYYGSNNAKRRLDQLRSR